MTSVVCKARIIRKDWNLYFKVYKTESHFPKVNMKFEFIFFPPFWKFRKIQKHGFRTDDRKLEPGFVEKHVRHGRDVRDSNFGWSSFSVGFNLWIVFFPSHFVKLCDLIATSSKFAKSVEFTPMQIPWSYFSNVILQLVLNTTSFSFADIFFQMVEITFKTLTQEAFKLELQPSDKVSLSKISLFFCM